MSTASTPLDRLVAIAREIQKAANDESAGESGYFINARLLGKLDSAIADIDAAGKETCLHTQAVPAARVPAMSCPDCGAVFRHRAG